MIYGIILPDARNLGQTCFNVVAHFCRSRENQYRVTMLRDGSYTPPRTYLSYSSISHANNVSFLSVFQCCRHVAFMFPTAAASPFWHSTRSKRPATVWSSNPVDFPCAIVSRCHPEVLRKSGQYDDAGSLVKSAHWYVSGIGVVKTSIALLYSVMDSIYHSVHAYMHELINSLPWPQRVVLFRLLSIFRCCRL